MDSSSSKPAAPPTQPSEVSISPSATKQSMHKNHLQMFAQRSNIAIPVYRTVSEGPPHAPEFRSMVRVGGMSFTSQITFSQIKAAEQEAARLALECLVKKTKDEGYSCVSEISMFCKSILKEYAEKLNLEKPTYDTVQQEGLLPIFISSIVFNGTSYTGDAARTKKDAEQLAARAAILSIMGNLGSGTMLLEMIKSKSKFYDARRGKGLQDIHAIAVSPIANKGNSSVTLGDKDVGVGGYVVDNNNEIKVECPESTRLLSIPQEFQMPKQESSPQATNFPSVYLQRVSAHSIGDGSSSNKRRKNKKKANKKPLLESLLSHLCYFVLCFFCFLFLLSFSFFTFLF